MKKRGIFLLVISILLLISALPAAVWTFMLTRDLQYMPSSPEDPYIPVQESHALGGLVGTLTALFSLVPGILGLVFREKAGRLPCYLTGGLLAAAGILSMVLLKDLWILLLPLTILAVLYCIAACVGKPEKTPPAQM